MHIYNWIFVLFTKYLKHCNNLTNKQMIFEKRLAQLALKHIADI